jgi:prepilin-type N-terminal cleavage/methylation domain-containing protein
MFICRFARRKLQQSAGITLLELMVVVAVMGTLAAIAIQQFMIYRSRVIDIQMRSDLKNAAMAMESYLADFDAYPTSVSAISAVGFRQTGGVALTINVTSPTAFTLTASKPNGTQASFTFDSSTGLIN